MERVRAASCVLGHLAVLAGTAMAEPRVVLVETAVALPALAAQIDLHGDVAVTTVAADPAQPVAARAHELAAQHDATLVVWVEAAPPPHAYVVYVAGPSPDRALIELVRVDASTPPIELARIVALKIVGLLETVLAPQPVAQALAVRDLEYDGWRVSLGADGVADGDGAPAAGPLVALERRWQRGVFRVSGFASARTLFTSTIEDAVATVSITDVAFALGGELGYSHWFVRAGAGASVLWASATDVDGRRGNAVVGIPAVQLGVGGRLRWSSTELTIMVGIDHALIRQRFLVDGMVVSDLGRDRLVGRVAFSLPVW